MDDCSCRIDDKRSSAGLEGLDSRQFASFFLALYWRLLKVLYLSCGGMGSLFAATRNLGDTG